MTFLVCAISLPERCVRDERTKGVIEALRAIADDPVLAAIFDEDPVEAINQRFLREPLPEDEGARIDLVCEMGRAVRMAVSAVCSVMTMTHPLLRSEWPRDGTSGVLIDEDGNAGPVFFLNGKPRTRDSNAPVEIVGFESAGLVRIKGCAGEGVAAIQILGPGPGSD